MICASTDDRNESTREAQPSLQPVPLASPQWVTRILLGALEFYRRWLSPAIHSAKSGGCRYLPTCSEYASTAIATHGPIRGVLLASWRLLRCNPFSRGGLDQIPPRRAH